jgi:hypothetical protein
MYRQAKTAIVLMASKHADQAIPLRILCLSCVRGKGQIKNKKPALAAAF